MIRCKAAPGHFEALLDEQRAWLRLRESDARAAVMRYSGGSMGAYSGWIAYNRLTTERLARLREIARDL